MPSSSGKSRRRPLSTSVGGFSDNLFWDINTADLDLDTQATFVVARVLNRGTWEDWLHIRDYYGLPGIKIIAVTIRSLNPKALAFISMATDTPKENFRCFTLIQSSATHWHY